jgi:hypothetical protein
MLRNCFALINRCVLLFYVLCVWFREFSVVTQQVYLSGIKFWRGFVEINLDDDGKYYFHLTLDRLSAYMLFRARFKMAYLPFSMKICFSSPGSFTTFIALNLARKLSTTFGICVETCKLVLMPLQKISKHRFEAGPRMESVIDSARSPK